jgi:hypothetical protein
MPTQSKESFASGLALLLFSYSVLLIIDALPQRTPPIDTTGGDQVQ